MHSRPTFEINVEEARQRDIQDGDFCRLFNDRGETFGYALILHGMLPGVIGTQKQLKGSATPGGANVNALNTEVLTDFGYAPSFYSVLAEIEKVDAGALDRIRLAGLGGRANYLRRWRAGNPDFNWDDDAILAEARATHPGLFDE